MADLRKTFGSLLAVHRRRLGLTQASLAERAGISIDMVSKLEMGATGARFSVIERLAAALSVDAAELFSAQVPGLLVQTAPVAELMARVALLPEAELRWLTEVVDVCIKHPPR